MRLTNRSMLLAFTQIGRVLVSFRGGGTDISMSMGALQFMARLKLVQTIAEKHKEFLILGALSAGSEIREGSFRCIPTI
jgi:hypothetical protein